MTYSSLEGGSVHRRRVRWTVPIGLAIASACAATAPGPPASGSVPGPGPGVAGASAASDPRVARAAVDVTLAGDSKVEVTAAGDAEVRRRMRDLAREVRLLTDELVRPEGPRQDFVLARVESVRRRAYGFSAPSMRENPQIGPDIDGFLKEVAYACDQAHQEPPDLGPARGLPGTCVFCHDARPCRSGEGTCPDVPGY